MRPSYYSHLIENNPGKEKYLDWIKYELDNRVYYYGDHFKYPFENPHRTDSPVSILRYVKGFIHKNWKPQVIDYHGCILSEAYFGVNDCLRNAAQCNVYTFPWNSRSNCFGIGLVNDALNMLEASSFAELVSDKFFESLDLVYETTKDFLTSNSIKLLVFPNDLSPMNRIAIDACKEVGIPTAIFLHGLPARYDIIDDNRSDYLCVWGEEIKFLYEKTGFSRDKILVTGHPYMFRNDFPRIKTPDLSNVLVLSKSVCGAPSTSDEYRISDRGICVDYPWNVEMVLKKLGVTHATLRLHPSENPTWYQSFIDNGFYDIDCLALNDSLARTSIVIGPTTTVAIDAARCGVPFFGYEPPMYYSYPLVPPFDNSEVGFSVAFSADELYENIMAGKYLKPSVFEKYLKADFDISILLEKCM